MLLQLAVAAPLDRLLPLLFLEAKLAAAVLAVYGSAERVPCASQVDAGRAAHVRNALSLAAREPPEGPSH